LAYLGEILRHLGASVVTLFAISVIAFAGTSTSGVDLARNILGHGATTEQLQAYADAHGLNRPVYIRYVEWLQEFARGDWGISPATQRPVAQDVVPRFKNTLILSVVALAVSVPVAVLIGLFMALRLGAWSDVSLVVVMVIVNAMPEFVVGIGLVALVATAGGWFPTDSSALEFGTGGEKVKAFVLPALTLSIAIIPYVARVARASAFDALATPYTQAAVLRGLTRRRVIWRHVMPNASVPLVNAVAINVVYLLSGVIVVENVFAFPGIGQELVQAIGLGDTSTVLAITMVLGATFIGMSFVADLLVVYLNPRLKEPA
jgi:peptide/nickel transport system permease protein